MDLVVILNEFLLAELYDVLNSFYGVSTPAFQKLPINIRLNLTKKMWTFKIEFSMKIQRFTNKLKLQKNYNKKKYVWTSHPIRTQQSW